MKVNDIIKVCKILDSKFEDAITEKNIDVMILITDIKKELFELIELPF